MSFKNKIDHTFICALLANILNVLIMTYLMLKFGNIFGAWNQAHLEGREDILISAAKGILSISSNKLCL